MNLISHITYSLTIPISLVFFCTCARLQENVERGMCTNIFCFFKFLIQNNTMNMKFFIYSFLIVLVFGGCNWDNLNTSETSGFSKFSEEENEVSQAGTWNFDNGNKPNGLTGNWSVVSGGANNTSKSLKSANIGNNQQTCVQTTRNVSAGNVEFQYKVSSEQNYDELFFYIDSAEKLGGKSGNIGWTQASYAVSAGSHTFKWCYQKDDHVSGGSDAAWIDEVNFPDSYAANKPPEKPSNISTSDVTADSIKVSWTAATDSDGSISGYEVSYKIGNGFWSGTSTTANTTYTFQSLQPATSYTFRIRTKDDDGDWSPYQTSTAVSTAPNAPTSLAVSARSLTFMMTSGNSYECSKDAGTTKTNCTSPFSFGDDAIAKDKLCVRVKASGNTPASDWACYDQDIAQKAPSVSQALTWNFDDGNKPSGLSGNWSVVSGGANNTSKSLKSANIGNNQETCVQTTQTVSDGQIKFHYKVSSEQRYDKLFFYINSAEKLGGKSGNIGWTQASYAVSAGSHTFKWCYQKDDHVSGGSDAVWIDQVNFPDSSAASNDISKYTWKQIKANNNQGWPVRDRHTSVVFKDKMWIIGGATTSSKKDVWSSSDGINWTKVTDNTQWSRRQDHTSVVFNDKIWVIGGNDGGARKNDVWSSSDGKNWTKETDNAQWSARREHTSVVFNSKIWVIGGDDGGVRKNDVWSSSDGKNWTKATDNAGWSTRVLHSSVVFNGKIWVMGGDGHGAVDTSDVWSSSDGKNWTKETGSAWPARDSHSSVVFNGKMWVLGGNDNGNVRKNDVWSSSDGKNWTKETGLAEWPARNVHTSIVFGGKIWVMGGYDGSYRNDVWAFGPPSKYTWKQVKPNDNNGWSKRSGQRSIIFDKKIWVIGGSDGSDRNDVWSSSDGVNWTEVKANNNQFFSKRNRHTNIVFKNKLWVIGGGPFNDVWNSSDGQTWTQETSNSDWSKRWGHTSVVFDGKIWVIGGCCNSSGTLNDVWNSRNGQTWTRVTGSAGWAGRHDHTSVVFDGKIWVMGGTSGGSNARNDVWSSSDGQTWKQIKANNNTGWSKRNSHASVVFGDKLWIMGGALGSSNARNDVWSSSDGQTWKQIKANDNTGWSKRYMYESIVFKNKIWVLGGYDGSHRNDVWAFGSHPKAPTNGLVAHYEFEGDAQDSSGNGNHGTAKGGVSYSSGKIGKAASFDGNTQHINVGDVSDLNNASQFTMSGWFYQKQMYVKGGMFSKMSSHPNMIRARTWDDGFLFVYITNNGQGGYCRINYSSFVSAQQWFHFVFTYDGSQMKVYLNKDFIAFDSCSFSTLPSQTANLTGVDLIIGENTPPNHQGKRWNGKIDDVRIYNRALSEQEVQSLYQLGR